MLSYGTMRQVALEIVQLGRDVPEEESFEDAEHYATSLIRRLCEETYDKGRQGELSSLGAVRRANLLDRRPTSQTTGDVPVRTDVFIHSLDSFTLESLRTAVGQGLTQTTAIAQRF